MGWQQTRGPGYAQLRLSLEDLQSFGNVDSHDFEIASGLPPWTFLDWYSWGSDSGPLAVGSSLCTLVLLGTLDLTVDPVQLTQLANDKDGDAVRLPTPMGLTEWPRPGVTGVFLRVNCPFGHTMSEIDVGGISLTTYFMTYQ
jgi:hypothetical protein